MSFLPAISTLVTFAFATAVYNRYRKGGSTHSLLWAFGLLLYGLGTLSEFILSLAFNPFILKLWYLTGAMLTAAWLGQGTVHLLVRKGRLASILTWGLTAVSLLALFLVMTAPTLPSSYAVTRPASEQYKEILTRGGLTITLTILLNIYGTLTLIGGAIYSAFLFWRKKVLANRMFGNILIATGAMFPALGGTFLKAGLTDMLYVSELVGAVIMYFGFIVSTSASPAPETATT